MATLDVSIRKRYVNADYFESDYIYSYAGSAGGSGVTGSYLPLAGGTLTGDVSMNNAVDNSLNFWVHGNIYATGEIQAYSDSGDVSSLWDNMPVATSTTLGGIKLGEGLYDVGDGVIDVSVEGGDSSVYVPSSGGTFTGVVTFEEKVYQTIPGHSTYFGYQTGLNEAGTGFINNAAFGYQALLNNTSGGNNTAIGSMALYNNTTGNSNIGIGNGALGSNTTGIFNIGIGSTVGEGSSKCIAIGANALEYCSGGSNIAIGFSAGQVTSDSVDKVSGDNNIYIGVGTRSDASEGISNEIAIGFDVYGKGSNTITIGNSSCTSTYLSGTVYADGSILATLDDLGTGSVSSVSAGNGMDFTTITDSGSVTMGTPATLTYATTNATTATSHTHAISTGIANTNIVRIDSASVADNEFARFTANGLESRSVAEVRSDIGAGTVTSVGTTGNVNGITLTGGTITTSGTITLGGSLSINNGDWSGTDLTVPNGGTGLSTIGTDYILTGNGTADLTAESGLTYNTTRGLWVHNDDVSVGGNIYATGEIEAYSTSDSRLKTDIKDFYAPAIIKRIEPKRFKWNEKAKELNGNKKLDEENFGIIAQDLQKVLPQLVKPVHGEYLAVDYEQLIPILIGGMKELYKENEYLHKEIIKIKQKFR